MTKNLFILFILSALHSPLVTAQAVDKAPQYSLLPLKTYNINPETRSRLDKELAKELQTLRQRLLNQPVKLSERLRQQRALNSRRMSDEIWTADSSDYVAGDDSPLIFEPVWCHIFDRDLLTLQITDRDQGSLRASHHIVFHQSPKKPYLSRVQGLRQSIRGIADKLLAQPLELNALPTGDALQVKIHNRRLSDWKRLAPPECVTILVEQELVPQFSLVKQSGLKYQQHIRQNIGQIKSLRRPTRSLHLSWPDQLGRPKGDGVTINTSVTQSEGPFGQPYPEIGQTQITMTFTADRINVDLGAEISEHLNDQREMLMLSDQPEAVHVYGAWVYLDKGRAWGLKMRDRLVASQSPLDIQGHVIRYYGAEAKLKDRKGRLINEGAIVYIRKGQEQVSVGQSFEFDPKLYPSR